jgi:cytochrome c peroxidase
MRLVPTLLITCVLPSCIVGEDGIAVGSDAYKPHGSPNAAGAADTVSSTGSIDTKNPFFQSLGTNGRACASCHQQGEGWSITPAGVQARFDASDGLDPIFRTNDGSNRPDADISTTDKRAAAFSMLRSRGVIRVGLPIPPGAEFTLDAVDDPYGYANAGDLSLFRRPLPSTNLRFLSTLMWDGRESKLDTPGDAHTFNLGAGLLQQSNDATRGHAQATSTDTSQMASIVAFETALSTAQISDSISGPLDSETAGGPVAIAGQTFFIGINDPLGENPNKTAFDPRAFTLFDAWAPPATEKNDPKRQRQYAINRGQEIFNTRPIAITGVRGLNDVLGAPTIAGTCTTCHDTPNIGNHSISIALDLGLTDEGRRTSDMPLYTLRNTSTGELVRTTDPGRALITGKWADIGKFKGAILRALSARPPYFHNGSAATLADVVAFYNGRFGMNLSLQETSDLVAFLSAL